MFQWLQMRIEEERGRRQKREAILARLPAALEELHQNLGQCVEAYAAAFAPAGTAAIEFDGEKIRVAVTEYPNGPQSVPAEVEVSNDLLLPGFRVERGAEEPLLIEVGLLPHDRLYFRHSDKYLTIEEMTRRILDRVLFPHLGE